MPPLVGSATSLLRFCPVFVPVLVAPCLQREVEGFGLRAFLGLSDEVSS